MTDESNKKLSSGTMEKSLVVTGLVAVCTSILYWLGNTTNLNENEISVFKEIIKRQDKNNQQLSKRLTECHHNYNTLDKRITVVEYVLGVNKESYNGSD